MCKYVLIAIALMLPATWSTLHEGFDFSNVDLVNFEYFKNLDSQHPQRGAQANPIIVHFQKKKAVLDYFERLFLGNSPFQQPSEIPFDPHFGRNWRPNYEHKFGRRGERLIAALGSGYSIRQLRHFGAIPQEYGTRHYPS
ncbi:GH19873 [Drosophila grimshawi]|uniref:GH19873 n=1 Tax=Drosophila grimshawi TaxID=7222 RepID=B4J992_DROGR|nr:GH19873 [Drosophila grimshawi]